MISIRGTRSRLSATPWNGEITGLFKASHAWTWEPKTNQITFEGKDKEGKPVKVTYTSKDLSSQPGNVKNEVHPSFVNDNYWFLLPFHVYWDTSATVTDKGMQKLPIGTGSVDLVSVKYPAEAGGYTPGDTWDLYIGKDNRIEAMFYHRAGPKKPGEVICAWAGYKKAGTRNKQRTRPQFLSVAMHPGSSGTPITRSTMKEQAVFIDRLHPNAANEEPPTIAGPVLLRR